MLERVYKLLSADIYILDRHKKQMAKVVCESEYGFIPTDFFYHCPGWLGKDKPVQKI